MRNVHKYFTSLKVEIIDDSGITIELLEGPQGCVSDSFYHSLDMLENCLISLSTDFHELQDGICLRAISTTLNGNLFARMGNNVECPDSLEFATAFPKEVKYGVDFKKPPQI